MSPAADGGVMAVIVQFLPILAIFILFYFLLIRPQQKRAKEHATAIGAIKRGDTVVLCNASVEEKTPPHVA